MESPYVLQLRPNRLPDMGVMGPCDEVGTRAYMYNRGARVSPFQKSACRGASTSSLSSLAQRRPAAVSIQTHCRSPEMSMPSLL